MDSANTTEQDSRSRSLLAGQRRHHSDAGDAVAVLQFHDRHPASTFFSLGWLAMLATAR